MTALPTPTVDDAAGWVAEHLGDLHRDDEVRPSERFRGGQQAADTALATLDISGYSSRRNQVLPESARGDRAVAVHPSRVAHPAGGVGRRRRRTRP